MMTRELARRVAEGLIETGVEGGYDNVCCSTSYDSLCIGCSSWEQDRGQKLLRNIPAANKFVGLSYSEMSEEDIEELSGILGSEEGIEAQLEMLTEDCIYYVEAVKMQHIHDARCIIYCALWCPTSIHCVCRCISEADNNDVDINDIESLAEYFYYNYPRIACCEDYEEGYQNRSDIQRDYVLSLEL